MLNAHCAGRSFAFLYITNLCNLACVHCAFQSAADNKQSSVDAELMLRVLDELYGIHDITITGGEPLLHPQFSKILAHASHCASIVYVMTNGICLVGLEQLKKLGRNKNLRRLTRMLKNAMDEFPENVHVYFPLDTFHLRAFRQYPVLLHGLSALAGEWNPIANKPFIGFLSNEVAPGVSKRLCGVISGLRYFHPGEKYRVFIHGIWRIR